MSSQEAVHVSRMAVTPTSGKGTLGTWWFLRLARVRLDKTEHTDRNKGQERSYQQTIRRRGVCAPALEPRDEREGSWTKCQGFKPNLRNSTVRHYRGPRETQPWWNCEPASRTERARTVTLHLPGCRARVLSQPSGRGDNFYRLRLGSFKECLQADGACV